MREKHVRQQHATITAQLNNALAREEALLREKSDLLRRHEMMAQEFEHRLFNSLQLIVSLLWLQSRAASTPEAATQLNIAADRVAALGRVHRQLHLLDHQERVEFKQYIQHLCEDLSGLLFQEGAKRAIVVEGADVEIPTALGIPLGFIVNELITNSANTPRAPSPFDWERRRPIIIGYRCRTTDRDCRQNSILPAAGDLE